MPLHRSRSGRAALPAAEGLQREPFSAGPFRQKATSSPSTTPARKGRQYGENQPPENVNLVRGNILEAASPALLKSASKKGKGHLASPALPPMPPSARPSPAQAGHQPASATLFDTSAKRKLSWEVQSAGATEMATTPDQTAAVAPVTEANVADNGVKVVVRVRPLTHREHQEGEVEALTVSSQTISLAQQTFTFDAVAGSDATQNDLFNMVGIPMVNNCIAGFNSSIFAYGQTGSGKTYTMWGPTQDTANNISPNESRGIAPRLFEQLFSRIQQEEIKHAANQLRYQCRCSFLEIHNEQITDLLEPSQKNLQIREDTKTGVYVENLTEEYVSGLNDITQLLLKGLANRSVGSTMMNSESSRSHSVFTCVIECRCKSLEQGVSSLRSSRMNLVDLAGSERQKQTGAAGERLKEAGNINRSLSQLGNVINILAEVAQSGKQRHIPYRDSRLTFLLQESLGGNAKLAMICSISTASSCRSETLSTLRFAKRAKAIQNKAVVNEETENDVNLLREQIRQLKEELLRMKSNKAEQPSGWNPRRSYNLLRMSLNYPMAFPKGDLDSDSDEEMEIDDPVSQEDTESLVCQESGIADGAIGDQIMEIEDDSVEVPVCREPGSLDGAIGEKIMEIEDDSAKVLVCQEIEDPVSQVGTESLVFQESGNAGGAIGEQIMEIEDDSAEVPVYREPGSADGALGEKIMDVEEDSAKVLVCQEIEDPVSQVDSESLVCQESGSADGAISEQLMEIEDDSDEVPVLQEPRSADGGIGEQAVLIDLGSPFRDDSPSRLPLMEIEEDSAKVQVCQEPEAIRANDAIGEQLMEIEDDSAEVPVFQEPGSAEDVIGEQTVLTDIGSPYRDDSPSRLPLHGNSTRMGSRRVAESQPYYDCKSVFDSCTRISLSGSFSSSSKYSSSSLLVPTTIQVEAVVQSSHMDLPTLPLCAEGPSDTVEDPLEGGTLSPYQEQVVELLDPAAEAHKRPIMLNESIEAFTWPEAGEGIANCVQPSRLSEDEPSLEMVVPTFLLGPEELPHVYEDPPSVEETKCLTTTQDIAQAQSCSSLLAEEALTCTEDPTANQDDAICVLTFGGSKDASFSSLEMVLPAAQEQQSPTLLRESLEAMTCAGDPAASGDTAVCVQASGLSEDAIAPSLEIVVLTSPLRPEELPPLYDDRPSVVPTDRTPTTQDTEQVQQCPLNQSIAALIFTEDPTANEDNVNCFESLGVSEDTMLPPLEIAGPTSPPRIIVPPASAAGIAEPSDKLQYPRGAGTICTVGELPSIQLRPQTQLNKAVEALLAGAIRREEAAEEKVRRQAAEIEQLNRLVRQYKHERECNAILQQSREDKIARLESLMDGVLPSDVFLSHEWAALTNEHQVLLDKYDNHPELTHSIIQHQRLIEELREYRDFFDLGEKEDMQKEIRQLRKQLQDFLDSGPPPRPLDSRRRSMLMQSISVRQSMSFRQSMCLRGSVADPSALAVCTDPKRFEENFGRFSEDLTMVVSEDLYPKSKKTTLQDDMKELVGQQGLEGSLSPVGEGSLVVTERGQCQEDKDREWEERENDWIAVLEELRLEADSYRRQAEMRTHELECERRCSEEVREALQMAMTGHARLLDQYAELQEKHISVLAKHRKIREGASDAKKMAKRAGVSQVDSRWLETQATKMAAMEADHEEERESMRQEMESLRAQLNDTADAVQAAGELLVRLKESEEAVSIAQDAALLAEQDADALQRELEKAKRKHATEIAVLQQRLLESRLQKSTLCQMCVMAERVKFEFTEVDEETAQAEMEAEQRAAALEVDHMAGAYDEGADEEHWVQSPVRYAQNADDWDYQSPARDNDPAAESRYDYYLDDYERGWRG